MRRRDLIALGLGAGAWPCSAVAQQKAMPVIGCLSTASPGTVVGPIWAAFSQGLREAGYAEG